MTYEKYLKLVKDGARQAVKVEWLNWDETVNFEFTNAIYNMDVNLDVNYQSGSRRSCTITLNNDKNKFPINYNGIWLNQKFKLWMGIYIDNDTPYYFPQGVFFVSNPSETYNPDTRTITINGIDKWAYLDGTLGGRLSGTYQTNIGVNLFDATRSLLREPTQITGGVKMTGCAANEWFDVICNYPSSLENDGYTCAFTNTLNSSVDDTVNCIINIKSNSKLSFNLNYVYLYSGSAVRILYNDNVLFEKINKSNYSDGCIEGTTYFNHNVRKGDIIKCILDGTNRINNTYVDHVEISNFIVEEVTFIDPVPPLLPHQFETKTDSSGNYVINCPYTATVERGKTYADILLEYATILCANVYYDVNGRLTFEPMIDSADDITDTNKEILWHYTVEEKTLLGLNQTYNFDKIYNDIIVLGNIVNGKQFKARVQNRNPMSDTCIQKIGIKTKEPIEDNQYVSDEQCRELATYYAKVDTIIQKSGSISSLMLYHLDVNKLVALSTPNNRMSKELFLITGFSLSSSATMTINITSINILNDFSVVGVEMN